MDDRTILLLVSLVIVSGTLVVLIYQAVQYFRRNRDAGGGDGRDSDGDAR